MRTKRKLLDDCNLWCIVSLTAGVFSAAGAGVKTNLLFFTKGESTRRVWYYDPSDIKVGKKTPFTIDRFREFFDLLPRPEPTATGVGPSTSPPAVRPPGVDPPPSEPGRKRSPPRLEPSARGSKD